MYFIIVKQIEENFECHHLLSKLDGVFLHGLIPWYKEY